MFVEEYKLVRDVLSLEKSLAEANAKLKAIEAKKAARALSSKQSKKIDPEEKMVGAVLRASIRNLNSQVYRDSKTLKLIVLSKLQPEDKHNFFRHINKRIAVLGGLKSFEETCKKLSLDPVVVAQHIVVRGTKTMNFVFKDGLDRVFESEELKLFSEPIFEESELDLTKYRPAKHGDS